MTPTGAGGTWEDPFREADEPRHGTMCHDGWRELNRRWAPTNRQLSCGRGFLWKFPPPGRGATCSEQR